MRVSYLQYDVRRDRGENLDLLEAVLPSVDCDLTLLPELCLGGYLFPSKASLASVAEEVPDGPSTRRLLRLSARCGRTIVFGLAEISGGRLYNTAVVIDRGRFIGRYRKIHLTGYEKTLFERGEENHVFDLGFCRLGVQICFDLWFPEISREQLADGADILCALGNFGGETTRGLARSRAIENLTPLVLCNRIGSEKIPGLEAAFLGKSAIFDRDGGTIREAAAGRQAFDIGEVATGGRRANVICRDFETEIALHRHDREG